MVKKVSRLVHAAAVLWIYYQPPLLFIYIPTGTWLRALGALAADMMPTSTQTVIGYAAMPWGEFLQWKEDAADDCYDRMKPTFCENEMKALVHSKKEEGRELGISLSASAPPNKLRLRAWSFQIVETWGMYNFAIFKLNTAASVPAAVADGELKFVNGNYQILANILEDGLRTVFKDPDNWSIEISQFSLNQDPPLLATKHFCSKATCHETLLSYFFLRHIRDISD